MKKPTEQAEKVNTEKPLVKSADESAAGAVKASAESKENATETLDDGKSLLGGDETAAGAQKEEGKKEEKKDEGKKVDAEPVPEKYEFKVPEGMQIDAKALEAVTPVLKELGLSQGKAQKLADVYAAIQKEQVIQSEMALLIQRKAWREDIKKDPKWEENTSLAKKAIKQFGDETFGKMIENSWMGDHPSVIKFLSNVARLAGDDRFVEGSRPGSGKKTLEQRLYPN